MNATHEHKSYKSPKINISVQSTSFKEVSRKLYKMNTNDLMNKLFSKRTEAEENEELKEAKELLQNVDQNTQIFLLINMTIILKLYSDGYYDFLDDQILAQLHSPIKEELVRKNSNFFEEKGTFTVGTTTKKTGVVSTLNSSSIKTTTGDFLKSVFLPDKSCMNSEDYEEENGKFEHIGFVGNVLNTVKNAASGAFGLMVDLNPFFLAIEMVSYVGSELVPILKQSLKESFPNPFGVLPRVLGKITGIIDQKTAAAANGDPKGTAVARQIATKNKRAGKAAQGKASFKERVNGLYESVFTNLKVTDPAAYKDAKKKFRDKGGPKKVLKKVQKGFQRVHSNPKDQNKPNQHPINEQDDGDVRSFIEFMIELSYEKPN